MTVEINQSSRARTVRHLQIARTLRSISQGIAVVDLALYLKQLHWSAAGIGSVLSAASLVGAALILLVGALSDRIGRKPFLLIYEGLTCPAALGMTFSTNSILLSVIIIVTGFGRGQSGAAGPFTPAEQAWMAACVPRKHRGRVFSVNNALGFFGMALGALLAGTPKYWSAYFPGTAGYRPLFFLMFVLSVLCFVTILLAPKEQRSDEASASTVHVQTGKTEQTQEAAKAAQSSRERDIRQAENRNMLKLAAVNLLNGLAIGFIGPLMSYWFAVKFGVSAGQIGTTMAISFVATGVSSVVTGRLTERYGMVRAVVILQLCGVILMGILPVVPTFWLASCLYVARSALARGTQGARSALSSSLTRDKRRGFSVSLNSLVMRLSSSVGPSITGVVLDLGWLCAPFYFAAVLQLSSSLLYGRLFRSFDKEPASLHS